MKKIKLLIIMFSLLMPVQSVNSTSFKAANIVSSFDEIDYSDLYNDVIDGVVSCIQYTVTTSKGEKNKQVSSIGSGFVFKEVDNGYYIMTNNHVIEPLSYKTNIEMHILTSSNEEINNVKIVGHDEHQDVAVLYINKEDLHTSIKVLGIETNLPNAGDNCFAIGNPASLSFKGTLSTGIISGIKRIISDDNEKVFYQDHVIQVDCPINSGNSGGPLFNDNGKVIGINTSKFLEKNTTKYEGLAFSMPIHDMMVIANRIMNLESSEDVCINSRFAIDDSINCQYMSLSHANISYRNSHGYNNVYFGVIVLGTSNIYEAPPFSILTKINGVDIHNVYELRSILFDHNLNDSVTVSYLPCVDNVLNDEVTKTVQMKEVFFTEEVDE